MLRQLILLKDEVVANKFSSISDKLFEGAGLVISDSPNADDSKNYVIVITPFAHELSSLIYQLKDICSDRLDYYNKYEFYIGLGKAANRSQEKNLVLKSILLDVIDEAIHFVGKEETLNYFAYGSNMDVYQMAERCPSCKAVGVGMVAGFQLALDSEGTATIIENQNDSVWGIIWQVKGEDIVALDRYEGVRAHCYGHSFIEVSFENQEQEALVYISNRNVNCGIQRKGYLEKIVNASIKWQFPDSYITVLKRLLS